jgi:NAD(P)-dependent dehydrogenase (short-subunit alcohol dehydrogenase family)
MKDLRGRTAVVTGAASGIGRALALHAAGEGMNLAVADVDEAALEETRKQCEEAAAAQGARVVAVPTDVSKPAAVQALANEAKRAFGGIHLVFNNAGVLVPGCVWERSAEDWEWQIGVNLFGCVHGARVFVPILIEQGEPAHIVNTASVGGVLVGPFLSPYIVSKHAVVALTEALYHELSALGTGIGVSCLCPGAVATGIARSERIRPGDKGAAAPLRHAVEQTFADGLAAGIALGMSPEEVARHAFAGVREGRFWIFPDPMYREGFQARAQSILEGTDPFQPLGIDADPRGEGS